MYELIAKVNIIGYRLKKIGKWARVEGDWSLVCSENSFVDFKKDGLKGTFRNSEKLRRRSWEKWTKQCARNKFCVPRTHYRGNVTCDCWKAS